MTLFAGAQTDITGLCDTIDNLRNNHNIVETPATKTAIDAQVVVSRAIAAE